MRLRSARPKAPKRFSQPAKVWWRQLTDTYFFDTPDSLLTLETVMECFDRAAAARELVEREGIVITDRFGQRKAHPATIVERDARMAMLRALKQLGLEVVPPGAPGRPAGR